MTTLRQTLEQARDALKARCGGRCNAEYNPCADLEIADSLTALLSAPAMPVGELTDQSNLAMIAGLEASTGHLSAMVDELRVLLARSLANFKTLHSAAKADDGPDMDAIIPAGVFAAFVNEDAAIRYALNQTCHHDALAAARTQPVREPMTDEQIRVMCKESWVFDTVKQWARVIEAHHGITNKATKEPQS